MKDVRVRNAVKISLLIIILLVSAFIISGYMSRPETFKGTIEKLDKKR